MILSKLETLEALYVAPGGGGNNGNNGNNGGGSFGVASCLKNKITFYTKVTPIEMLAQLTTASGGLERVDVVDLLFSLATSWNKTLASLST